MVLYLAAGAAGLPVFTPIGAPGIARFLGPTGGYLIAYPAAAFVAGMLSQSRDDAWRALARRQSRASPSSFLGGIAQLSLHHRAASRARVQLGVTPFAALDLVKAFDRRRDHRVRDRRRRDA